MVRKVLYRMPPQAGKRWFKIWFKDSFLAGYHKLRSDVVFHIAVNHNAIFGIADIKFRDKRARSEMPEVKELRSNFQYQFVGGRPDPDTFYRHDCIVKTVRYILRGSSSIPTEDRSSKARDSHATLWHVKEVTLSIIAFAVTVIDFVLSGEATFERITGETNYEDFFRVRLELMRAFHETHPEKFDELVLHYNRSVYRHLYPAGEGEIQDEDGVIPAPDAGMSQADMAFMEGL